MFIHRRRTATALFLHSVWHIGMQRGVRLGVHVLRRKEERVGLCRGDVIMKIVDAANRRVSLKRQSAVHLVEECPEIRIARRIVHLLLLVHFSERMLLR